MSRPFRRILRAVLFLVFVLSAWATYANVLSDDTEVRALADSVAHKTAGCGDKCRVTSMHGDRGVLSTSVEYDFGGHGHVLVVCRRPWVVFGEWECK
ncbi:MAG: hypothetical protein FWD73_14500 [Polyangiaceae bacterium]|nr:hypothetical protein [Polyangiaceae bacterium]